MVTIILLWGSGCVSLLFPHILDAFGILGGINGTFVGVLFPGIIYLVARGSKGSITKNIFVIIITLALTIVGFLAAYKSASGK